MTHLPNFVLEYLMVNNLIGKTKTLVIGENYPSQNYLDSYFYRSLPECMGNSKLIGQNQFFKRLCDGLQVPSLNEEGSKLCEFERLNKFLEGGFLVIDSQPNHIKPSNPAVLTSQQSDDLVKTILIINPINIIFLTKNNLNVINIIKKHPLFFKIEPKIIFNHLKNRQWYSFPSAPANPNLFKSEIETARLYYYI